MYWLITWFRNWLFDRGILTSTSFPIPVISIGNLAVGGTGKTPHTITIAEILLDSGLRVGVLSRGYGRHTKGYRQVTAESTVAEVGDEPIEIYLALSGRTFSAVCEDRVAGIRRMMAATTLDVLLLDDAYQHRYVKPSLSVLLTDIHRPYWRDHILPYGRLREGRYGAGRADIVVTTKHEQPDAVIPHPETPQTWLSSSLSYGTLWPICPEAKLPEGDATTYNVLLLTGIAHPEPLLRHVQSHYGSVTHLRFADHHDFTAKDATRIETAFASIAAPRLIITTAKDACRLSHLTSLSAPTRQAIWVQPVKVCFGAQHQFLTQILQHHVNPHSTTP